MWKKILFDFDFPPLQHIHTTLISRSFSTFFPLFSPFFFQPGLSTHRSSRAAFDKPYTHTHTHTYPLSKRTMSAPFFVFLRDIPSPPYLCHRFHLLRGLEIATLSSFYRSTRPASSKALNFVPSSNDVHRNVHRRAIHVHGRKIRMKRNTYTKLEFISMKKFA